MLNVNYHGHTNRCGHAVGEDEEYIQNAIKMNYKILGISDHCPYRTPYPPERMNYEQFEEYLTTLRSYQEKYKDQIQLYVGCEIEYYPSQLKDLYHYRKVLDYCILGQHNRELDVDSNYCLTKPEQVRAYGDRIVNGCASGLVDIVAHPDLFMYGYPQWDEACEEVAHRICQASLDYDIPLELNMGGVRYGIFHYKDGDRHCYPDRRFFEIVEKYGCKVIPGLDIHDPKWFLDTSLQKTTFSIVEGLKLNYASDEDIIAAAKRRKHALFSNKQHVLTAEYESMFKNDTYEMNQE